MERKERRGLLALPRRLLACAGRRSGRRRRKGDMRWRRFLLGGGEGAIGGGLEVAAHGPWAGCAGTRAQDQGRWTSSMLADKDTNNIEHQLMRSESNKRD
uniref:Uncharacterized protein n=1 Tax=Oryza nivara TaxID=4536 RepID=A0A0E0GM37_ORYNI